LAIAQRVKTVIDRETFANALLISILVGNCQIAYQKSEQFTFIQWLEEMDIHEI
jgi:hypothetical protein